MAMYRVLIRYFKKFILLPFEDARSPFDVDEPTICNLSKILPISTVWFFLNKGNERSKKHTWK